MAESLSVKAFWQAFCEACGVDRRTPYQIWYFSNTQASSRELAGLVTDGPKRATASLVAYNEKHPEAAPVPAGYSVVTDFAGEPLCVLRTTEIRHLPFDEVDAEFAYDEGEGDRTLADWREGHWRYFSREAAENDLEFDEKSLVCCERFELLYRG